MLKQVCPFPHLYGNETAGRIIGLAQIRQARKWYVKKGESMLNNLLCKQTRCEGMMNYINESELEAKIDSEERERVERLEQRISSTYP